MKIDKLYELVEKFGITIDKYLIKPENNKELLYPIILSDPTIALEGIKLWNEDELIEYIEFVKNPLSLVLDISVNYPEQLTYFMDNIEPILKDKYNLSLRYMSMGIPFMEYGVEGKVLAQFEYNIFDKKLYLAILEEDRVCYIGEENFLDIMDKEIKRWS